MRAKSRIRRSFTLKIALTCALVVAGDWLFWQLGAWGGAFGLYGLALVLATVLAHPSISHHRPAAIVVGAAEPDLACRLLVP